MITTKNITAFILQTILLPLFSDCAKFYVTNPLNGTIWQAGRPANVTWLPTNAKSITIELIPSTDLEPRVVSILAQKIPGTSTSITFTVPENLPAWTYGIRMYDPDDDQDEFSFSPAFLMLDKDGKGKGSKEPAFPLAPSPKSCTNGVCAGITTDDPRKKKNSGNEILANGIGILIGAAGAVLI